MTKYKNDKVDITAMIPARMGSTRLAMKNLALICGKPMVYYAIKAARDANVFNRVVVNSDDAIFGKIARRYGVGFYKRPAEWGTSEAKSDFVVYDFLEKNPCDIVVWVNTTSPLQTASDVRAAVNYFMDNNLDTLITVKDEQVHCVYGDEPINFSYNEEFAKTQDLAPVRPFVYSVMIWRSSVFMSDFRKNGRAFFCGKVGYYLVGKLSSVIIKREEDLVMADHLMRLVNRRSAYKLKYDKLLSERKNGKR